MAKRKASEILLEEPKPKKQKVYKEGRYTNANEIIRGLLKNAPYGELTKVANKIGCSAQSLAAKLNGQDDIRLANLITILDVLGYDVVAVPKGTDRSINALAEQIVNKPTYKLNKKTGDK